MNFLLEELETELKKYNLEEIIKVIDNKEKSARMIKKLIGDGMDLPCERMTIEALKTELGDRINHILFTFSLGLLLAQFLDLKSKIEEKYAKYFCSEKNVFFKTWLIIALYHDYGYFLLGNPNYNNIQHLSDFNVTNDIFDYLVKDEGDIIKDNNDARSEKSRYSKDLFFAYFKYRLASKNSVENFEHGISGGYVLFDDIIRYTSKPNKGKCPIPTSAEKVNDNFVSSNLFYQNICYRIMEHNVWTVNNLKVIDKYPNLSSLYINNFEKISENEPLLFLLSLVDTIEFIKRMSTTSLDNPSSQSRPTTLSKKIQIEVTQDHIWIGMKAVGAVSGCEKWCEGIVKLKDWVCVNSVMTNQLIQIVR